MPVNKLCHVLPNPPQTVTEMISPVSRTEGIHLQHGKSIGKSKLRKIVSLGPDLSGLNQYPRNGLKFNISFFVSPYRVRYQTNAAITSLNFVIIVVCIYEKHIFP